MIFPPVPRRALLRAEVARGDLVRVRVRVRALTLTLALILNQVDLWSAVFYVSEGEPNAPGFPSPLGGHMVLRALTNP